jgi:hypothetical protein
MGELDEIDVCVIGAGPAGLAALSAIVEPYSLDSLSGHQGSRAARAHGMQQSQVPRVCVVDPEPWLTTWRQRFQHLNIEWLRSPTLAHPDAFDSGAMLAFASKHNRTHELLESGCVDSKLRQLQEASTGSWHLPSNKLFMDFCDDLASRSPHVFVKGQATSIQGTDGQFTVSLEDGRQLRSAAIVLTLGVPGPPVIPACIATLPPHLMFHSDFESGKRLEEFGKPGAKSILVLGGGLTAVQVALLGVNKKCKVTLCSRRPLTARHFDIDKGWFDKREAARHRFEFFSMPLEERLAMIKETRGGGSVPSLYMSQVRRAESQGSLKLKVAEAQISKVLDDAVEVEIDGSVERFDRVVSACGHRPDCTQLPLMQSLLKDSEVEITGGLPHLSQDLQWGAHSKVFVIGSLASLQVGPDAGNLMGIRRAAQTLTSTLGLRDWLADAKHTSQPDQRSLQRNIRGNSYDLLMSDADEDDEEPDEELTDENPKEERRPTMPNSDKASKRRLGKRRGGHKGRSANKNAR